MVVASLILGSIPVRDLVFGVRVVPSTQTSEGVGSSGLE